MDDRNDCVELAASSPKVESVSCSTISVAGSYSIACEGGSVVVLLPSVGFPGPPVLDDVAASAETCWGCGA